RRPRSRSASTSLPVRRSLPGLAMTKRLRVSFNESRCPFGGHLRHHGAGGYAACHDVAGPLMRRPQQIRMGRDITLRQVAPNAVTAMALCFGLTAIRYGIFQ